MFDLYDDIIPPDYQEEIKHTLLGGQFPWYFLPDVTGGESGQSRPGFFHNFSRNYKRTSDYYDLISPLGVLGATKFGLKYSRIIQSRSFLQLPIVTDGTADALHIDVPDTKHMAVLYYVMDSDGDTILTNKIHKWGEDAEEGVTVDQTGIEEVARITPKQGRCLVFDGSIYHTAFQPTKGSRCIINLDIITES